MASLWRRRRFMWEAASLVPEAVRINILSSRPWFFLATLFFPLILLYPPSFLRALYSTYSPTSCGPIPGQASSAPPLLHSSTLILPIVPSRPRPFPSYRVLFHPNIDLGPATHPFGLTFSDAACPLDLQCAQRIVCECCDDECRFESNVANVFANGPRIPRRIHRRNYHRKADQ